MYIMSMKSYMPWSLFVDVTRKNLFIKKNKSTRLDFQTRYRKINPCKKIKALVC